jgi:CBS domain-containing protein
VQQDEIFRILLKTDPFDMLETDVLQHLVRKIQIRVYPPGAYVFRQDEVSQDALFIIASGLVELVIINDRGMETVIGLRRPFDFFGETVVFSRHRYPGGIRVKKHLCCCLVFRRDLEYLLCHYPEFCTFFNRLLAERMRLLYEKLVVGRSADSPAGSSGYNFGLFRKRVSEVMSSPVITCRIGDSVRDASRLMWEKDIDAVVVTDRENHPRGILMEKNLVRNLIARQKYPVESCRVEDVMNSSLTEVRPQTFIGQALVAMMRKNTRHLVVMEKGGIAGIVSLVDLVKTQSAGTMMLTRDIESQPHLSGLTQVHREIRKILKEMVEEKATLYEIFDVMSELRERLIRRAIRLSEEKMKSAGFGSVPAEYCWINMGSGARFEQTFAAEQDNALMYADKGDPEKCRVYFTELAERIVRNLERCGFERCQNEMMAVYETWRKPFAEWVAEIHLKGMEVHQEKLPYILPLLDFRPVWGNFSLAEDFRSIFFDHFRKWLKSRRFEEDHTEYKLPIRFLGTFSTENRGLHKNEMNLKKSAIMPMIHCIRLMAAANGITEPSTLGRLKILTESGIFSEGDGAAFSQSFEFLMMTKIRENIKKIERGKKADHYIDPYSLRKNERLALKDALAEVSRLTDTVKEEYGGFWLSCVV